MISSPLLIDTDCLHFCFFFFFSFCCWSFFFLFIYSFVRGSLRFAALSGGDDDDDDDEEIEKCDAIKRCDGYS